MRTNVTYYNERHEQIRDDLVGSVTEVGTEKQMTIFPNIKEQMVIFRFREKISLRSGYLEYFDPEESRLRKFSIVRNLKVSKGTSVYGSEYR